MSWQTHMIQWTYLFTPFMSACLLGLMLARHSLELVRDHRTHGYGFGHEAMGIFIALILLACMTANIWIFVQVLDVYYGRQILG